MTNAPPPLPLICRVALIRTRQALHYSRADVLRLGDAESLYSNARASRHWLSRCGGWRHADGTLRRRLALAAAVAEDEAWRAYEIGTPAMGETPPPLAQFDPTRLRECVAEEALPAALEATPLPPNEPGMGEWEEAWERRADVRELLEPLAGPSDEEVSCWEGATQEGGPTREGGATHEGGATQGAHPEKTNLAEMDDDDEARQLAILLALEQQIWLELDSLMRRFNPRPGCPGPLPPQLLGLLPPAPPGGWPVDFWLDRCAHSRRQDYARQVRAVGDSDPMLMTLGYVPVDCGDYPARRRCSRLSWVLWSLIGKPRFALQQLLELKSTSARLRLALLRLRDLAGK